MRTTAISPFVANRPRVQGVLTTARWYREVGSAHSAVTRNWFGYGSPITFPQLPPSPEAALDEGNRTQILALSSQDAADNKKEIAAGNLQTTLSLYQKTGEISSQVSRPAIPDNNIASNMAGKPGALLEISLRADQTLVFVGDLHGHRTNFSRLLSKYREGLDDGSVVLLLAGDLIHPARGEYAQMEQSMQVVDFLAAETAKETGGIWTLRGNHDDCHGHFQKAGVPQGFVFAQEVIKTKGQAFLDTLQKVFETLPLVAQIKDSKGKTVALASHSGYAPSLTSQTAITAGLYQTLAQSLTWSRPKSNPIGNPGVAYFENDARKMLTDYGLNSQKTYLLGGHTYNPDKRSSTYTPFPSMTNHILLQGYFDELKVVEISGKDGRVKVVAVPQLPKLKERNAAAQANDTAVFNTAALLNNEDESSPKTSSSLQITPYAEKKANHSLRQMGITPPSKPVKGLKIAGAIIQGLFSLTCFPVTPMYLIGFAISFVPLGIYCGVRAIISGRAAKRLARLAEESPADTAQALEKANLSIPQIKRMSRRLAGRATPDIASRIHLFVKNPAMAVLWEKKKWEEKQTLLDNIVSNSETLPQGLDKNSLSLIKARLEALLAANLEGLGLAQDKIVIFSGALSGAIDILRLKMDNQD